MILPQLCKPIKAAIDDPNYIVEQKLDGIRAQLTVTAKDFTIENRSGLSIAHRFPEIIPNHKSGTYILDGEIVYFKDGDTTDFQGIQKRMARESDITYYAINYPAVFMAFDCLVYDNISVMHYPLLMRKHYLEKFTAPNIKPVTYRETDYIRQQDHANWEGFIYKLKSAQYSEGKRNADWLKYKFLKREVVWVVGFTHGMGRRSEYFGALVVARLENDMFQYAGTVGTGFTDLDLAAITDGFKFTTKELDRDFTCRSTYHVAVQPFKVEVEYLELTNNGIMRQPAFKEYVSE